MSGGTVYNCTISENSANQGGGMYGGTAYNCIINFNEAYDGGGVYGGLFGWNPTFIYNCIISDNSADFAGGGGCFVTAVENCIIIGNSAEYGGGMCDSTNSNCTISDNWAAYGGGLEGGTLENCIVYYNSASYSGDNWYGVSGTPNFAHSCTTPHPGGTGNITAAPQFVAGDDYHLQSGSPCINEGNNAYVSTSADLDGNPRISGAAVDMGAYEYQIGLITRCSPVDSGFALEWNQLLDCDSVIKYSTNLVDMPFIELSAPMPYPLNCYTDLVYGAASECFYKVEMVP
jgi:hypothetical protein